MIRKAPELGLLEGTGRDEDDPFGLIRKLVEQAFVRPDESRDICGFRVDGLHLSELRDDDARVDRGKLVGPRTERYVAPLLEDRVALPGHISEAGFRCRETERERCLEARIDTRSRRVRLSRQRDRVTGLENEASVGKAALALSSSATFAESPYRRGEIRRAHGVCPARLDERLDLVGGQRTSEEVDLVDLAAKELASFDAPEMKADVRVVERDLGNRPARERIAVDVKDRLVRAPIDADGDVHPFVRNDRAGSRLDLAVELAIGTHGLESHHAVGVRHVEVPAVNPTVATEADKPGLAQVVRSHPSREGEVLRSDVHRLVSRDDDEVVFAIDRKCLAEGRIDEARAAVPLTFERHRFRALRVAVERPVADEVFAQERGVDASPRGARGVVGKLADFYVAVVDADLPRAVNLNRDVPGARNLVVGLDEVGRLDVVDPKLHAASLRADAIAVPIALLDDALDDLLSRLGQESIAPRLVVEEAVVAGAEVRLVTDHLVMVRHAARSELYTSVDESFRAENLVLELQLEVRVLLLRREKLVPRKQDLE